MSPVPWATVVAPLTETVISVMIRRRNPRATRIRPSQGDGGIDVIELTPQGWVVDQIKYFATSLDRDQKRQIEDSLRRVQDFARTRRATIAEWRLVTPLDPTKENLLDWFETLTADAGFPCEWRGQNYVDGLAAEFPDVIDYYLRDGKDHVNQLVAQVVTLCGLFNQAHAVAQQGVLEPPDSIAGLRAVHEALNAHDPHYSYSFSVDMVLPDLPPEPDQVAVVQVETGSCWITFKVFTRYDEAILDREISAEFTAVAAEGTDAARILADHHAYGSPLDLSASEGFTLTAAADLPAGLGALLPESIARLSITPVWGEPRPARMQVTDADGRDLQTVRLGFQSLAYNTDRSGFFLAGTAQHDVFDIEIRVNLSASTLDATLTSRDCIGKAPADMLPGFRLLSTFHHPHLFRLAGAHGPLTGEGIPITPETVAQRDIIEFTALVNALCAIQDHTTEQIVIPDLDAFEQPARHELLELAELLRNGRRESTWSSWSTTLTNSHLPESGAALLIENDLAYNLDGKIIRLGRVRRIFRSVQVAAAEPDANGNLAVRFVPKFCSEMTTVHLPQQL